MINYRLVENQYDDGRVRYIVEKEVNSGYWDSVYASPDITAAKAVLAERRAKVTPVKSKVIDA